MLIHLRWFASTGTRSLAGRTASAGNQKISVRILPGSPFSPENVFQLRAAQRRRRAGGRWQHAKRAIAVRRTQA